MPVLLFPRPVVSLLLFRLKKKPWFSFCPRLSFSSSLYLFSSVCAFVHLWLIHSFLSLLFLHPLSHLSFLRAGTRLVCFDIR